MKNPHHWIRCNFMRFGQLSKFGVYEAFDLATIVQWSKKFIVDGRWAFEVGENRNLTFGLQMNGQNRTYNIIYKQAQKIASYFYCSRACCWGPAPPRILPTSPSKLEISLFCGYSSHIKYRFSATNWRYMQKSCECIWPLWQNLSSIYGHTSKISKEISGHRGSSQLKARFTYESSPKTLGANFEHFGLFVGLNLLINARTLTSGY
jgi:hypothetical protein